MKCHEIRRYLDPFLDGEIEVETNLKVLEHLNLCPGCSRVYEGEKSLRGVLRESLQAKAPPGMAERLSRSLTGQARVRWWRPVANSVAAALFIGMIALLLLSPTASVSAATFAERAVSVHDLQRGDPPGSRRCPCDTCCKDCRMKVMEEFFQQALTYAPCLHDFGPVGWDTCGASVWEPEPGQRVCWTCHRCPKSGRCMSHLSVKGIPIRVYGGESVQTRKVGVLRRFTLSGRTVLIGTHKDGLVCMLIFDAAEDADHFLDLMNKG